MDILTNANVTIKPGIIPGYDMPGLTGKSPLSIITDALGSISKRADHDERFKIGRALYNSFPTLWSSLEEPLTEFVQDNAKGRRKQRNEAKTSVKSWINDPAYGGPNIYSFRRRIEGLGGSISATDFEILEANAVIVECEDSEPEWNRWSPEDLAEDAYDAAQRASNKNSANLDEPHPHAYNIGGCSRTSYRGEYNSKFQKLDPAEFPALYQPPETQPYMVSKRISAPLGNLAFRKAWVGATYTNAFNLGEMSNWQDIRGIDGKDKRFQPGLKSKGQFYVAEDPSALADQSDKSPVVMTEGMISAETGKLAKQALRCIAVGAPHNYLSVAVSLHRGHRIDSFLICADTGTEKTAAETCKVLQAVGIKANYVVPDSDKSNF